VAPEKPTIVNWESRFPPRRYEELLGTWRLGLASEGHGIGWFAETVVRPLYGPRRAPIISCLHRERLGESGPVEAEPRNSGTVREYDETRRC
jgi:hypothetical protein